MYSCLLMQPLRLRRSTARVFFILLYRGGIIKRKQERKKKERVNRSACYFYCCLLLCKIINVLLARSIGQCGTFWFRCVFIGWHGPQWKRQRELIAISAPVKAVLFFFLAPALILALFEEKKRKLPFLYLSRHACLWFSFFPIAPVWGGGGFVSFLAAAV